MAPNTDPFAVRTSVTGNSTAYQLPLYSMTSSSKGDTRRWYRVVHVNPMYRLVEIKAETRGIAEEVTESLSEEQFIYSDDDGWQIESVEEVTSSDLMNPVH